VRCSVLVFVALAVLAGCSAHLEAQPFAEEDIRLVCEWYLLNERMGSEVLVGISQATEDFGAADVEELGTTAYMAHMESSFREMRRQCRRGSELAISMRKDFESGAVRTACDRVSSALDGAAEAISDCIGIFEEADGNVYRLMARQSDVMATLEEMNDAASTLEQLETEKAQVTAAAQRLLAQLGRGSSP
jgi:hypothetical protein